MASTIYEPVLYNRKYFAEEKYGDYPEYNIGNRTPTSPIREHFIVAWAVLVI